MGHVCRSICLVRAGVRLIPGCAAIAQAFCRAVWCGCKDCTLWTTLCEDALGRIYPSLAWACIYSVLLSLLGNRHYRLFIPCLRSVLCSKVKSLADIPRPRESGEPHQPGGRPSCGLLGREWIAVVGPCISNTRAFTVPREDLERQGRGWVGGFWA